MTLDQLLSRVSELDKDRTLSPSKIEEAPPAPPARSGQ